MENPEGEKVRANYNHDPSKSSDFRFISFKSISYGMSEGRGW
jgi:hypothetical protein